MGLRQVFALIKSSIHASSQKKLMSQFFDILTDRKTERKKDRQKDRRTGRGNFIGHSGYARVRNDRKAL